MTWKEAVISGTSFSVILGLVCAIGGHVDNWWVFIGALVAIAVAATLHGRLRNRAAFRRPRPASPPENVTSGQAGNEPTA